ncbi:MAG: DUF4157 domain-containing protein, partial [Phaeodactylibacter sp.]|nr:DUF4157 domain-containing protein [Phaeodactylibacter sp.]
GRDLFFNKSHYKPEASKGKWLLGHELGHFVQQEKYQLNNEKEPSNRWGIQRKKKKSEEKETYSLEECPWTCEDCNKWEEEDLAAKRNANPKIIKAIKQEYKNCRSYCEGGWQKYDIPTHLKKHKEFWRIFSSMIHTTYVVGTTIKDKDKKEAYLSKRKKEIWKYLDRTMTNKAFWRAGIRGYK